MRHRALFITFLMIVLTGSAFLFQCNNYALAGGGGPTTNPIEVYEIGTGNAACGPAHQIRLRFTYAGVQLFDQTLNNGDPLPRVRSSQEFEAGKTLKAELYIIVKATGEVKASDSWEGKENFDGSTGWTLCSGPWADRPYFHWICRQAEEYNGVWYIGFEGEQHPPEQTY